MPTHNPNDPVSQHGEDSVTAGYEKSDVNVQGLIVFLAGLASFLVVFFFVCFYMGQYINGAIEKHDGPATRWNQASATRDLNGKMLTPNPVMEQQQLADMTQRFPTPRLQTDDGNQEMADMHAREDLLLEHYSWVAASQGTVRIPIERAMQLIAERGLPVAPAAITEQPLTADEKPVITAPLTNGFARTGFEQEVTAAREQGKERKPSSGEHAALNPPNNSR